MDNCKLGQRKWGMWSSTWDFRSLNSQHAMIDFISCLWSSLLIMSFGTHPNISNIFLTDIVLNHPKPPRGPSSSWWSEGDGKMRATTYLI
jgi:hypothetical protein